MKKLYNLLPHWTKFFAINIYSYFLEHKRYSRKFHSVLRYYLNVDKTESSKINMRKISELVKDSNFYSIKNEDDFYSSPIINKEIVKENYDAIFNKKYFDSYLVTSGTTGSGLKYPVSREFIYHQWSVFWKFRIIHGVNLDSWCAYLIGKSLLSLEKKKPPFWIKSYSAKQLLLSLPHLNRETTKIYLEQIKKNKIKWIHAYPSALNMFASLIEDLNLQDLAKSLEISLITTSSEMFYDYQRKKIENVFCCKVRQLYGLTEGVANIYECEESSLHVDESFSHVEFIKDEEDNDHYKIIGTQYHNKAFPLIRYDTGDKVLLYEDGYKCKCGRNSRVVKEIVGREQDYLLLDDDTKMLLIGNLLFKKSHNVKKAQIIQERKGEADFYIIKGAYYTQKDEKDFITLVKDYLGHNFKCNIIYTDNLQASDSGKTSLIINRIVEQPKYLDHSIKENQI